MLNEFINTMENNVKKSSGKLSGLSNVNSNAFFFDDLLQSSSLPENGSSHITFVSGKLALMVLAVVKIGGQAYIFVIMNWGGDLQNL